MFPVRNGERDTAHRGHGGLETCGGTVHQGTAQDDIGRWSVGGHQDGQRGIGVQDPRGGTKMDDSNWTHLVAIHTNMRRDGRRITDVGGSVQAASDGLQTDVHTGSIAGAV